MNDIKSQWMAGRGLPDVLVIDGHIHIHEWPHAPTFCSVDEAEIESQRWLDANGVDAFCAMSGGYIMGKSNYRIGNDILLKVWRRLPDRLIPFMGINPNDGRENVLAELKRMTDAGIHCIKLIEGYQDNYPGDGPNLMALFEYAAEHRMLVFNHWWSPPVILKISGQFPDMDFIFGHYGGQDAILQSRPNVYVNTWNYLSWGSHDRAFKNVDAGKFMLGSDGFLNPLSVGIGPIVFADIPDDAKRKILGLNMARLLDKVGALPKALSRKCKDG